MASRVLLTGATGFVGRVVAGELERRDHELALLVRGPDAAGRARAAGVAGRIVAGGLEDAQAVQEAVRGADVVVHLAAVVGPASRRDPEVVRRINRDAAVELGRIARREGVRRFVFMSSIAAMGFWSGTATSGSVCRPSPGYGSAKLEAERALLAMQAPDFDVVVLRPPTIYGPGEPYNFLEWVRAVDRRLFRVIGSGDNAFPLATTANVARATRAAVEGRLSSGVFLIGDAARYSMNRIHAAMLRALRREPPRLRLPLRAALAAAVVNEALARVAPRVPVVLTRDRVRTLTVDQRFDLSPLARAGVELDAPLEEWIELTVRDYERRGVLR